MDADGAIEPETNRENQAEQPVKWKAFLEQTPPEVPVHVHDSIVEFAGGRFGPGTEPIQLYCDQPECQSTMWFDHVEGRVYAGSDALGYGIMVYRCRHCQHAQKHFALIIRPETGLEMVVLKIGEVPAFGPPTPSRVISLIGPDRELFLKGRKSENRGLGIGAFVYYRRGVENQKNRILEAIIRVAKKVNASDEVINPLQAALAEDQFSKAVDSIKDALPESLLIDGHNPLKLLHAALSRGIHERDDSKCLELAQSIRIVLTELADRISSVLKEQAELKSAVAKILQERTKA